MKLDNRTIIVVGASGGIGSKLCQSFYREGANVVLTARTREKLEQVRYSLGEERTLVVPADASDPAAVRDLFSRTKEKFGRVDAVVISAGSWARLSINDSSKQAVELLDTHFAVILKPAFIVGFELQKLLREQGSGLIANISSHAAIRTELKGNLTYGPMKAAARWFILGLRNELAGTGVRVTDIQPALVNTPETQKLMRPEDYSRAVQPEEIADWLMEHFDDPEIPAEKLFDSQVKL